jgi:hypothetical protein
MSEVEVLDPRYDAEPAYWTSLRERAGLRADWSWDVLRAQAWCARTRQPVTVLLDGGEPIGVVSAAWVTGRTRRHRFTRPGGRGLLGGLDVRAPGSSAVPGWWFAGAGADQGIRELLDVYAPAMRHALGPGFRGMLLRQVSEPGLDAVRGRFRLIRKTEDIGVMPITGLTTREEWTRTLAKKRRQNLAKIFRTIEGDGSVEVRVGPAAGADPVRVANLLRHNERKHHDVPIVPVPQFVGYLSALFAKPDVVTCEYLERSSGRLLGVATVLDDPLRPIARHWSALPPEEGGRQGLYFHFYGEMVKWAIAAGRPEVVLGKKMAELKKTLGANLEPQYAAAVPVW